MFMYGVPLWSRVQIVRFGLSHILHVVAAAKNSFFYGPAHHLKLLAAGDRVKALELASNSRSMPFNGLCSTILAGPKACLKGSCSYRLNSSTNGKPKQFLSSSPLPCLCFQP